MPRGRGSRGPKSPLGFFFIFFFFKVFPQLLESPGGCSECLYPPRGPISPPTLILAASGQNHGALLVRAVSSLRALRANFSKEFLQTKSGGVIHRCREPAVCGFGPRRSVIAPRPETHRLMSPRVLRANFSKESLQTKSVGAIHRCGEPAVRGTRPGRSVIAPRPRSYGAMPCGPNPFPRVGKH